jgi:hypothetical protein
VRLRLAIVVVAVAVAIPARAQIVNVQPLLLRESRPGFSGSLESALDWRTGNLSLLLFTANAVGRYQHGRHLVFLLAHAEFGIKSDKHFLDKDLEHLRYRVDLVRFLDGEVFVQHDRDEFRRLELRVVCGIGPRIRIVSDSHVDASVGAAYMFELERIASDMLQPDSGAQRLNHRISTYAVISVHLARHFHVGTTVYWQPRVDRPTDLHLLGESSLLATVNTWFSLRLSVGLAYDSNPPDGVQRLDTRFATALHVSF